MLEFFRRSAPEKAEPSERAPAPALEPTTRMLVLRRSQAIVAAAAAVAALLLAFLVGHAVGGSGGDGGAPAEVYVIRAVEFGDDETGVSSARRTKEQLDKLNLGDEIQILHVPSRSRTVVAVGSWLSNPLGSKDACDLRDKLRGTKDVKQATPFASADFWKMER
jgi:hypothetical protein